MFSRNLSVVEREEFLRKAREKRELRDEEKKRSVAAVKIQNLPNEVGQAAEEVTNPNKWVRNVTGKQKVFKQLRVEVDGFLSCAQKTPQTGTDLFIIGQKLLFVYHPVEDNERFISFCQVLLTSMESPQLKVWYVSVAVSKTYAVAWIKQMKHVLVMVLKGVKGLKPGLPKDDQLVNLYLNMLVVFTDYTLWKFTAKAGDSMKPMLHKLCSSFIDHLVENGLYATLHDLLLNGLGCAEPKLAKHSLPAAMGIRSLALCQFPSTMMALFIRHVMSVPACVLHLQNLSPETLKQLEGVNFVSRVVDVLHSDRSVTANVDDNTSLCIFANIVHLGSLHVQVLTDQTQLGKYLVKLIELVSFSGSKKSVGHSATANWHPFFGWCTESVDRRILSALEHVKKQLQCLWSGPLVDHLFSPIFALTPAPIQHLDGKGKFIFTKRVPPPLRIDKVTLDRVCDVCRMYNHCFESLKQISTDLIIGLGCSGTLVTKMWYFLRGVMGVNASKVIHTMSSEVQQSLGCVLALFCQITQYLLALLDDEELFIQQKHFSTADLIEMSTLMNRLVFRMIMDQPPCFSLLLTPCHSLLMLLYDRDSRRPFCEPDHWLIKELKTSSFVSDLKAGKTHALEVLNKIPHIIPHRKRVEIFYQHVEADRQRLGLARSGSSRCPASYITVHRGHILEDGYAQLSQLTTDAMKGTIRVKFINEQGLDEVGIDETGVFKEFLEDTIMKAFDPSLNLFKTNSKGHLFPSATSHIHENHLSLFEFVGRMLGKAVYEGIVLDVPFAPFFLSQMLEHHHSVPYSCIDELPSMDPELYKSLSFIKHHDGDVSDLCLTFSWDEDFMGKLVSHELIPGGCAVAVTNENRINYVHRMAHFRMRTQLRKQTAAFIQGFHSIVNKSWIMCFSPQELQRLISGDQVALNVDDLRKHAQYYGGYHDRHKVVCWLWEILKNDFTLDEKAAFLKFVTSCSKPPLLGFSHLEPPFSIRCVELTEEEDRGDSLSSVLRGFFSVRQHGTKDRLPTASTCFNLLKLPNYTKKSVLRDKLRYAISSNAGFELS